MKLNTILFVHKIEQSEFYSFLWNIAAKTLCKIFIAKFIGYILYL